MFQYVTDMQQLNKPCKPCKTLHDGLELALDYAEIGGQSEWELEFELVGGSMQAAEQLVADLREASIELVPQPLSKLQRLKQRRPEAFSAT